MWITLVDYTKKYQVILRSKQKIKKHYYKTQNNAVSQLFKIPLFVTDFGITSTFRKLRFVCSVWYKEI